MAETIAESARKASAGSWRKPRMKIYDYNQVSFFFTYLHIYLIFCGNGSGNLWNGENMNYCGKMERMKYYNRYKSLFY